MQRYQSHKIVEAAKILSVVGNEVRLESDVGGRDDVIVVLDDWLLRFKPASPDDLGYLVRYQDGYMSWSPTRAFEDGYDRLPGD